MGFNSQYFNIGSDNGLVPVRQQAIIWTNDGLVYWHKYVSLGLNELNPLTLFFISINKRSWDVQNVMYCTNNSRRGELQVKVINMGLMKHVYFARADSRFAVSQWETLLQSNAVSHWLSTSRESALLYNTKLVLSGKQLWWNLLIYTLDIQQVTYIWWCWQNEETEWRILVWYTCPCSHFPTWLFRIWCYKMWE